MRQIPSVLVLEKNKIASSAPWLLLLDLILPNGAHFRFVRNTEDVTFLGNTYTALPFEVDAISEESKGQIPNVVLRIANVGRILQGFIEETNGAVGARVILTVAHASYLTSGYMAFQAEFDVIATHVDALWITLTLGIPNPMRRRFPTYKYIPDICQWDFKSAECGYTGQATSCNKTLARCRELGNSRRFGGFIGLSGGNLRIVW